MHSDPLPKTASAAGSLRALEWLNFWVADVQTGVGPFLAAYLAFSGWNPAQVGLFLSFGGMFPILFQAPAGGAVDLIRNKRSLIGGAVIAIAIGALLIAWKSTLPFVASAQILFAVAGLFLAPSLAAIALGIVGPSGFSPQIGRNQSFSAAGNVVSALLMAGVSYWIGMRSIFIATAFLAIPSLACLSRIDPAAIDNREARGGLPGDAQKGDKIAVVLLRDRALVIFLVCAALFHLANAAMLPQLGEMLAHGHGHAAGAFMSACVIVTQFVITVGAAPIGKYAAHHRRRPLLLLGFGALIVRGWLYTIVHGVVALVAVQLLDGVANVIFGLVAVLVIADRTQGTGRFNLTQGALASAVGLGAALSTTFGGLLVQKFSYNASFLGLAAIGLLAWLLLFFFFPETHGVDGVLSAGAAQEQVAD